MVKASVGKGIVYFFTALFAFVFIAINLAGIFFIFTLFNVAFASQPEISQTNKMCITCHEEEKYLLQDSVHQKLDCTFCHTTFKQFPHPTEINLAQEVQVACQRCHQGIAQEYAVSIHGDEKNSLEKGTTCYSCHGSHDIFTVENPEAKHNRLNVNDSCIQCHDGRVLEGYNYSFHGVAFNSGYIESANCVDCHGSHSILPEDNPASMVSMNNRPETCAKCHKIARENFAKGSEHITPFDKNNALPLYITLQIFILLILFDATKDSTIAIFDLIQKLRGKKSDRHHVRPHDRQPDDKI